MCRARFHDLMSHVVFPRRQQRASWKNFGKTNASTVSHLKLTTIFATSFKIVILLAFFTTGSPSCWKCRNGLRFLQPHSSIVTHSNFQPLWPKRGIIPLFCLSDVAPIDEQHSHVLTHYTWKKFLEARSPRGSSPFANMKGKPGELEHSAVERMNHSATINHLSVDAFHPRACNNNSISVTVSSHDVYFVFKRALI